MEQNSRASVCFSVDAQEPNKMFKLVVLSALVAVAMAKPGHIAVAAPVAYSAHVHAVPAAVSHSSRVDVHSKPLIATAYAAPAVVHAPAVHAVHAVHAAPVAAVHAVHTPVAAVHAAPVLSHGLVGHSVVSHGVVAHAAPLAYAAHHY